MKVKFIFAWYDLWIGIFIDRKKKILYVFPLPTLGVAISLTALPENYWFNEEYGNNEYPYCMFFTDQQVGAFKSKREAIKYANSHNYNKFLNQSTT